jgi:DNA-binding Lrp family transcriptional regulator
MDFYARDSIGRLAKRLRMSEDTLNYRIKRLEKLGVIKSYHIVPDTTKLGLVSYKVMLKYQNTTPSIEKGIIGYLETADEVGWLVKTEGHYDLMFIAWVKNEFTFDEFFSGFMNKFSKYFYLRDMVVLTENHACQRTYLSYKDVQKAEVSYKGEPKNLCDEVDFKVISILMANARSPTVEIAKKIGLTPEAISYRIRELKKKGVITAFRPRIDLNKINYFYYNVMFRLNKASAIPQLFSYAMQNPNVTYFVRYVGSYDMGFDIEVESPEKFRTILAELRERFGPAIFNYNYTLIYDEVKITY